MRHLLPAFLLLACSRADNEQGETIHGGEPAQQASEAYDGGSGGLDAKESQQTSWPSPAEMPAPPPLPYGIAEADPYEDDPNGYRACDEHAEELFGDTMYYRGPREYCHYRSYRARRGAYDKKMEPKRWADGSYIHSIDVRAAAKIWSRFHEAGWVDPEACPRHSKRYALQMFTRGKWFDMNLYQARHLVTEKPLPCFDPAIIDRTDVSARIVVVRAKKLCEKHRREGACTLGNLKKWWKDRGLL